jgi:hypothetical protein
MSTRAWVITLVNVAIAALAVGLFMSRAGADHTEPTQITTTSTVFDREGAADAAARRACTTWDSNSDQGLAAAAEAARYSYRWNALYKAVLEAAKQEAVVGGLSLDDAMKNRDLTAYGPLGHQIQLIWAECGKAP